LQGGANLQAYGNNQANTIYGNSGNNLINGAGGIDLMVGGGGNDTYFVDDSSDSCFENAAAGNDTAYSTVNYGLAADVEALVLQGSADLQGYGNNTGNSIYGNSGNNLINGGGGADTMVGGAGNDTYFVDDTSDSAFELAGEGTDAVFSSAHYGLAADVETLILLGSAVVIDLGFVLFEPQLLWYVGLSGVLHGALAAGAIAWWQHETRPLALALTAILAGKLSWEQWHGALPLSGDMPVIVDAHLYGAIGGLVVAAGLWVYSRRWSVSVRSL